MGAETEGHLADEGKEASNERQLARTQRGRATYLPPREWLPRVSAASASSDAVAGLLLAVLLVPQAMAYAMLAGLPPQTGLYAAMAPAVLYAALGTSRYLSVGPVALVSLLVADTSSRVAGNSDDLTNLAVSLVLAVMVGLFLVLFGVFRLGYIANFLSTPVLVGFTAGAAVLIGASQLGALLGLEIERGLSLFGTLTEVVRSAAQTSAPTAILGTLCLAAFLLGSRAVEALLGKTEWSARTRSAITGSVPLVVLSTALVGVRLLGLQGEDGVATVGEIKGGLPTLQIPTLRPDLWQGLIGPALSIALISFVIAIAIAKSLASRRGQRVDASQEMIALGVANVGAGLTGACPVGGSMSRSALVFDAGGKTPIAQLVAVVVVLAAVLSLGPLLADLPRAALAALILSAVVGMIDLGAMQRIYSVSRFEALTVAATFIAVVTFGVQAGVLVGAASALILYLWRTSRPRVVVEGFHGEVGQFASHDREGVEPLESDLVVVRIDESLYFANVRHFEDRLLEYLTAKEIRAVVIDLSAVGEIDSSALDTMERLVGDLEEAGLEVAFSQTRTPVRQRFERGRMLHRLGEERFYATTLDAVAALGVEDGLGPRLGEVMADRK